MKLLDFGIAKLLRPELYSDRAEATRVEEPLLTPEYASPEQARGDVVTTASDVYSPGVLLYGILTGHHPDRLSGRSRTRSHGSSARSRSGRRQMERRR